MAHSAVPNASSAAAKPHDHGDQRGSLAPATAAALRHAAIRRELRGLLRAWKESGLEVLVFKGFHLAEFVYDQPAQRTYSDVDLLLREDAPAASRIARENGWRELWSAFQPDDMHKLRGPRGLYLPCPWTSPLLDACPAYP